MLAELDALRDAMTALEERMLREHPALQASYVASARNFAHYLALRGQDVRTLQSSLSRLGLSSLGRTEAHVLANVDAVRSVLHGLLGLPWRAPATGEHPVGMGEGAALLARHTEALLGAAPEGRSVRVMVTLPSEAADDLSIAQDLVRAGMDVARINCAHDDAARWERMAAAVRRAAEAAGRPVKVLMDLAGPKLRTGDVEPGPAVLRWSPARDARGQTVAAARVWLSSGTPAPEPCDAAVPVEASWWTRLVPGDAVRLVDIRGRKRRLRVVGATGEGRWAEALQSTWVEPGVRLVAMPRGRSRGARGTAVGSIAPTPGRILLRRGDLLVLTRDPTPGRAAVLDAAGDLVEPARIPCTLSEVFDRVRVGDAVWLDDGKIGGRVQAVDPARVTVTITQTREGGAHLGADKGINLPDTDLGLRGLTPKDVEDLAFVRRHADLVGLSFVEGPADVEDALRRLRDGAFPPIGVVVKVETRRAFDQLARIVLAAMAGYPVGVMIARGDLAVECGFERLAELQEEILWMCEAAHVPVVWATQVLETLAKKGMATRAEITDAAMAERAECVMLNKGPHVLQAVAALKDILVRMEGHQRKKVSLLRPLHISSL